MSIERSQGHKCEEGRRCRLCTPAFYKVSLLAGQQCSSISCTADHEVQKLLAAAKNGRVTRGRMLSKTVVPYWYWTPSFLHSKKAAHYTAGAWVCVWCLLEDLQGTVYTLRVLSGLRMARLAEDCWLHMWLIVIYIYPILTISLLFYLFLACVCILIPSNNTCTLFVMEIWVIALSHFVLNWVTKDKIAAVAARKKYFMTYNTKNRSF